MFSETIHKNNSNRKDTFLKKRINCLFVCLMQFVIIAKNAIKCKEFSLKAFTYKNAWFAKI